MKKFTLLPTAFLFLSATISAQMGVNTTTPNSTMDISAKRDSGGNITDNTQVLGLQAPRVTLAELSANTATYSTNQQGALIYVTDVSGGTATGQRVNINETGYYSFDGSIWQKLLYKNIYNSDGSLTGPGTRRTLTVNGKELSFEGTGQRTYWSADGSMNQSSTGGGVGSLSIYGGNNSNLFIQQFQNSEASISATDNATALDLATHSTAASAPVTISTSIGGGALATEKMRVTGEGNVGIGTNAPQVTLDVAGTPATATILDGIRAPQLTGNQLRAKTYTTNQSAALVYVTVADTAPAGQTINVTTVGYYYFDGTVWQKIRANDVNIYSNNGSLISNRTLTNNGFALSFTGSDQLTSWASNGTVTMRGTGTTKRANLFISSDDNDSNGVNSRLSLFQDPEGFAQMTIVNDSRGLNIGSTSTTTAAPITFMTSAGSNALGIEKMRITGTGNVGVNTSGPTEKLDNNGITRLRSLPLNGTTNAIYTTSGGTASANQDQTFTATRTVVADANGVLGYVNSLPAETGSAKVLVSASVPGTQNIKNTSSVVTGDFSVENIDVYNAWNSNVFTVPAGMGGIYVVSMQNSNFHTAQSGNWNTIAYFDKSTDNGATWGLMIRDTRSNLGGGDIDNGNSLYWTGSLNAGDKVRVRFNCTATTDNIVAFGSVTITKLAQ